MTTTAAVTSTSTSAPAIRWNTAKAFLKPARGRSNLTILTHAEADRIEFDGKRVTGLSLRQKGAAARVTVAGELLLSAGSIGSPQILELSGIGQSEVLQEHGIEVVHELSGVGENLQDHLQVRCAYKVSGVKTLNERTQSLFGKAGIALEYFLKRSGPMSMAPSQLGAFAKSDPSLEFPNLQYHVQPLTLEKFGEPLHPFPRLPPACAICARKAAARCTSRAEPRATSPPSGRITSRHCRSHGRSGSHSSDPAHRQPARHGALRTRRVQTRPGRQKATKISHAPPGTSRQPFFTRSEPPRWAAMTAPWSTTGCGCTAFKDCAWSMLR